MEMTDEVKTAEEVINEAKAKAKESAQHSIWDQGIGDSAYPRGNASKNRGNASKNRGVNPDNLDLPALLKEKELAIAKIDRQASEAKDLVERDFKLAILKITNDLKRVCSDIRRTDKLKNRKPPVTRSEAKSRVRSEKMTSQDLLDRLEVFDGCCAYCSELLGKNKQVDHVVPISKLGADTLDNIVFVCQSCNCSKGDRDFLDWYRSKSFWTQEQESKVLSVTGKLNALKI